MNNRLYVIVAKVCICRGHFFFFSSIKFSNPSNNNGGKYANDERKKEKKKYFSSRIIFNDSIIAIKHCNGMDRHYLLCVVYVYVMTRAEIVKKNLRRNLAVNKCYFYTRLLRNCEKQRIMTILCIA